MKGWFFLELLEIFDVISPVEFLSLFLAAFSLPLIVIVFVPLGYYLEFKGRYYREKWFEAENNRRKEHPEQFNNLSYRIADFFRFGRNK